jgi:hypothetical protein
VLAGAPRALVARGVLAYNASVSAARRQHHQQVQMGRFLQAHYAGAGVAANDIGAITYYAPIRCLDLVGLADREVAMLRRQAPFGQAAIDRLSRERGVKIAVIYEHWFQGKVPAGWQRVGRWHLKHSGPAARNTVAFFAVDPAERATLAARLAAFAPELPADVELLPDP